MIERSWKAEKLGRVLDAAIAAAFAMNQITKLCAFGRRNDAVEYKPVLTVYRFPGSARLNYECGLHAVRKGYKFALVGILIEDNRPMPDGVLFFE
jgi:hypothetical protein